MGDARGLTPADVLAFWRDAGPDRWFARDDAFDAQIRRRFFDLWPDSKKTFMPDGRVVFGKSVLNSICFGTL